MALTELGLAAATFWSGGAIQMSQVIVVGTCIAVLNDAQVAGRRSLKDGLYQP
jgi:hypothetical protein